MTSLMFFNPTNPATIGVLIIRINFNPIRIDVSSRKSCDVCIHTERFFFKLRKIPDHTHKIDKESTKSGALKSPEGSHF